MRSLRTDVASQRQALEGFANALRCRTAPAVPPGCQAPPVAGATRRCQRQRRRTPVRAPSTG